MYDRSFIERFWISLLCAFGKGDIEKIPDLLSQNPSLINARNGFGATPLALASMYGQKSIVDLLISKGADINTEDNDSRIPLTYAAANNHKELVKFFVSKGSDVNHKDNFNRTPIMWAADCGRKEIVEILLSFGADVNIIDINGMTADELAIRSCYDEIAALLRNHRAKE